MTSLEEPRVAPSSSPVGGAARESPWRLEVDAVSKRFWGTQALSSVSLTLANGEVLGLVGENGAGKSTLLNVLSGCERPDSGRVIVDGKPVRLRSYNQATHLGIFRIFQELSLVPNLPIFENVFLSHEQRFTTAGVLRRRAMIAAAQDRFDELGHGWIDVRRPASSFDFAVRQVIEIIKAFALARLLEVDSPVILLDEPTAALSRDEIGFLVDLLTRVREQSAVVFVSHRLTEVLQLSDRLLVLKDGAVVAERPAAEVSEGELHHMMVGRERDEQFYKEGRQQAGRQQAGRRQEGGRQEGHQQEGPGAGRLVLQGFSVPGHVEPVDLAVGAGEILGIAGVMGAGKSELARAVFGLDRRARGEISVDGRPVPRLTVAEMIRRGVGYVTPDRQDEGILPGLSVAWNISLASLARARRGAWLDRRAEAADAEEYVRRLSIRTAGVAASVRTLSGGNQQKVVLARWLALGVNVLVLDNPTRGVDAGAKEQIYDLLRDLTDRGVAILLVSDDLLEVIGVSDRVLVMREGAVVATFDSAPGEKPSEEALVAAMV